MTPGSICVLGGSGFVGTHLCAALTRAGWQITVPTRDPARARHLGPLPSLKLVAADIHDQRQLAALCAGQRAVVNLIGILNERGRSGRGFEKVHVELVRRLIEACPRYSSRLLEVRKANRLSIYKCTCVNLYTLHSKQSPQILLRQLGAVHARDIPRRRPLRRTRRQHSCAKDQKRCQGATAIC